jgi:small subunit ribosomal protein S6
MNKYELAVVISAAMDEEAVKAELESIKEMVTKLGGTIEKVDEWGKRRLAYEINKTNEGFYTFIAFDSESDTPNEIEKRMRIRENVLRYLVVRQEG